MKLMKAVKKLKFWSSKKRKKDNYYYNYHKLPQYDFYPYVYHSPAPPPRPPLPSPTPAGCPCHFCEPVKPSAPPLPPWLESQLLEGISGDSNKIDTTSNSIKEQEGGDHCDRESQAIVVMTASTTTSTDSSRCQLLGNTRILDSSCSATQQHSVRREKDAAGLFGCVVDVGALLFRCFFPCLHISDRSPYHHNSKFCLSQENPSKHEKD